jgi:hypothetical protein
VKFRLLSLAFVALSACSAGGGKDDPGTLHVDGGTEEDTGPGGISTDDDAFGLDIDPDTIALDPDKDNDGDGYLFKDDCDDTNKEINPGAYDVPGDKVDNDCNGMADDTADCDTNVDINHYKTTDAFEFAKALGLCKRAKAGATGKDKTWGVISAELVRSDGSPISDPVQYSVLRGFGPVKPRAGKNLVVLSSGTARTPDYPDFKHPRTSSYTSSSSTTPPAGWPKNTSDCLSSLGGMANDSVNLKMKIRVPSNAQTFTFDFDFYSSEYITFVCSSFNDSFVAILDSKKKVDPKYAGNISFDSKGNPVNVNSGFFEVCTPGSKSGHTFDCAKGTSELDGTGFWPDTDMKQDGATSWLETKAPVEPGEEITIQFMIWDTGDHILDSTVLLDNWQWDAKPTTGPVTDRPK